MTLIWLIAALAGCLVVQAFFAASEIALVSADDLKVRAGSEGGHERTRVLGELLANRDRLLALTLTGTNLATIVAAVVLTSFLHRGWPHLVYLAPFILTPISSASGVEPNSFSSRLGCTRTSWSKSWNNWLTLMRGACSSD